MADATCGATLQRRYSVPRCHVCDARPASFGYRAAGTSRHYCRAHRAAGDAWLGEIKRQRLDRLEAL